MVFLLGLGVEMSKKILIQVLMVSAALFSACAAKDDTSGTDSSSSEDSSSSGLAAGAVGGALASSSSSGSMAMNQGPQKLWSLLIPQALASNPCPRVTTANGSGCTNGTSNSYVDLTYDSCNHGSSLSTWSGTLQVSLGSGAITCGAFPSPTSTTLTRQFVSSGVPATGVRTTPSGKAVVIDHATANLSNFDNQTIAANVGTGYGEVVTFDGSGNRTAVQIRKRLFVYPGIGFDHTIDGSVTVSESGSTRTISGSVVVYHNKLKVVGTSTFTNVTYNNTSCIPVSGEITTAYAAGANVSPTNAGSGWVGRSETMVFNSDGTGTFTDYSGATSTVTLSHCY